MASKAIKELRNHFNQIPVPNSKVLKGERERVNALIDAVDRENSLLRQLVQEVWQYGHSQCPTCGFKDDCNENNSIVCILLKHIEYLMDESDVMV